MCLIAISAPRFICSPKTASLPVIGPAVATTRSWALAGAALSATAAAAAIRNPEILRIQLSLFEWRWWDETPVWRSDGIAIRLRH